MRVVEVQDGELSSQPLIPEGEKSLLFGFCVFISFSFSAAISALSR